MIPWPTGVLCLTVTVVSALAADGKEPLERVLDRGASVAERIASIRKLEAPPSESTAAALAGLLVATEPLALQQAALDALAGDGGAAASSARIVEAWPGLSPGMRARAVDRLLSHTASSRSFLEALLDSDLRLADIPAGAVYRLRNHDDDATREKARAAFATRARQQSETSSPLFDELEPRVCRGGGDAENGVAIFDKHCSICHRHEGKGTEIGPDLYSVELLGAASLLRDTVDPNRSVDGPYVAYALVTKDGSTLTGIIGSEDEERVVLKRSNGSDVVPRSEILSLRSQGLSLMPERLEKTLSEAELRDLLTFLAKDSPFLALELSRAANADSSRGLFEAHVNRREALPFKEYGNVTVNDVPYRILHPAATAGRNIIVLRGGPPEDPGRGRSGALARSYPRSAEVPCGIAAKSLHFLGGVGGWAFPEVEETSPALAVTLHYRSGESEVFVLRNGVEIASYKGYPDVPGSKLGLRLRRRQVRTLSVKPSRNEVIERVELAAMGNVAPVVVAITAERS